MAFQYNHYYEIYNYSSGKYVNLNGDHENDVVNNGEKVTMYARTNNPDQRWALAELSLKKRCLFRLAGAQCAPLRSLSIKKFVYPIEKLWSTVKSFLRKFKARTLDALPNAIQNAFHSVTISDCSGWFRFCGYAL